MLSLILYDILPLVTTDIDKSTIMDYLSTVVTLGATELETMRIPVDNAYTSGSVRGMSVLLPNTLQDNIDALHTFIFGSTENETINTEGISTEESNLSNTNTDGTQSTVGTKNSTSMQP